MKVVWGIKEDVAIPVANIKEFEIISTDDWCNQAKENWTGGRYIVKATYTICYGVNTYIYSSDSKEDCRRFIENL